MSERHCESCSLCCKLLAVPDVTEKGVWCRHARPGSGCGCAIYKERPEPCRDFHCLWLVDQKWGDYWRPDKCRIVIEIKVGGGAGERGEVGAICFHVDPDYPTRWQDEPWHSDILTIARAGREGRQGKTWATIVMINSRPIVI